MTSPKTSPTEAGQTDSAAQKSQLHIDAINQVFALFRLNFHNQFYSAFVDTEVLKQAKRLWLESLSHFPPEQILKGAKRVIENSEYLPTLHRMIQNCEEENACQGFPSPREAYMEACNAPSPKAAHNWSHPAVYYAGVETGWHALANQPESSSYQRYENNYRSLCRQIAKGVELEPIPASLLEDLPAERLSKEQNLAQLAALRKSLDL